MHVVIIDAAVRDVSDVVHVGEVAVEYGVGEHFLVGVPVPVV